ncbi:MAG TPA: (Fe-S)-binding protein, partial [Thermodesulfovibrionales bacterium]|nr:(Fe-S)-binding protein [Thermodesulfovibrionales bacterium]
MPRSNCGECTPKTCMSFAVSLGGNPDSLAQCRHITHENLETIQCLLAQGEWKDGLIESHMEEVSKLRFDEIASDLGCILREGALVVRCIGQEYSVGREGTITPDTRNKWIKILILHY